MNLQVHWTDNCGGTHNQTVAVDLLPAPFLAVAISSFQASAQSERVKLSATFRSDLNVENVAIYRAVGNGPMQVLDNVVPTDQSRFAYTDTRVTPGSRYRYQLGITDADGEVVSQIRAVTVPKLDASLEQNVPNPFNPLTTIRFTLPSRDHAAC